MQLYVSYPGSKIERPIKQLKGFKRVFIPAGETRKVDLVLQPEDLSYWSTDAHRFVIEPGKVNLQIGSSSEDIKLKKFIDIK